eukprot:123113-Hanusia_phi.AAC.1
MCQCKEYSSGTSYLLAKEAIEVPEKRASGVKLRLFSIRIRSTIRRGSPHSKSLLFYSDAIDPSSFCMHLLCVRHSSHPLPVRASRSYLSLGPSRYTVPSASEKL